MKHCWILLLSLLLAACAQSRMAPGTAYERIDQELKDAAASAAKSKKNEALNRAMLPPLAMDAPTPAVPEPRFDLAVNGAPAQQVFTALVAGSKYSMLVPPEVTGSLTLNLKRVTVREALEAIRDLYGYEFSIKGTRIFIQPNTMQTRMFQINYLASRRVGQSDVRVTSSSPSVVMPSGTTGTSTSGGTATPTPAASGQGGPGSTRSPDSSAVLTHSDSDFWKELRTALSAIVGTQDGRAVIINPLSGVVLIKAMPNEMRAIENYLKATQLIVERQVMLEAKILEVQLNDGFQTGINWARFGGGDNRWGVGVVNPGTTLGSTGNITGPTGGQNSTQMTIDPSKPWQMAASALGKGFFGLAFQAKDFAAMLSFLETQGDVHVLSSPRVAAINNQKAVLKVGTDDFFVTNVSTTATSSGNNTVVTPSITLQPFFSGVALDVMPQIDEDNNIILHVHPSVSVVQEKTKNIDLGSLGVFTLPLASSSVSETDSVVRVQDGQIVAIGGLMSQEQVNSSDGLPVLGRGSGLGLLFSQKTAVMRKRELVILIKPTIIQGENAWRQDLMDTQIRVQSFDPRPKAPAAPQ